MPLQTLWTLCVTFSTMLYYWSLNKKPFLQLLILSFISSVTLSAFIKADGTYLYLFFNTFLYVFLFLFLLFSFNLVVAYDRFKKLRRIYSLSIFETLPEESYKLIETKPALIFFPASLSIQGSSKSYPLRIEYVKPYIEIVIGIESKEGYISEKNLPDDFVVSEWDAIRRVNLEELLANNQDISLLELIEETTSLLQAWGIKPFKLGTT